MLLFFVECKNDNYFFQIFLVIPRPSRFIIHWLFNFTKQKLNLWIFSKKQKKMQVFSGSFSIFRPFKWSQHCYLFCIVWKQNYIFKNIPSYPPPFAVRNSSTKHFYQINWGLWIFSKKKKKCQVYIGISILVIPDHIRSVNLGTVGQN